MQRSMVFVMILKTSIDGFYSDFGIPPFFTEGVKTDIPFKIKEEWIRKDKLKVLFGHFSPFVNGIGSIDFPLFFSKVFPNSKPSKKHLSTRTKSPPIFPIPMCAFSTWY